MTMRILAVGLLLVPLIAWGDATLYKWKDAEGTVHFSDKPQDGAEKIEVRDIQTVPAVPPQPDAAPDKKPVAAPHYDSVTITEPANEATLHDNTGNIAVSVEVKPPLRSDLGHTLQLSLDGQPQGKPGAGTQFSLDNVDRGTHTLQANVLDKDGQTLASGSSTFYLHRYSILTAPNAAKPPGGTSK